MLPLQDLGFNLNKREFRDAVKLRYDWPVEEIPSTCACGEAFTVDHSMRSALFFLGRSRTKRVPCEIKNVDIDVEIVKGATK